MDIVIIGGIALVGGYFLLNPGALEGIFPGGGGTTEPPVVDEDEEPPVVDGNGDGNGGNGDGNGNGGDKPYDCARACRNCWCKSYSEKCSGSCSRCCGGSRIASKCGGQGVKSCGGGGGGGGDGGVITSFQTYANYDYGSYGTRLTIA